MSANTLAASAWKLVSAASRMERTEANSDAEKIARRDFENAESELREILNAAPGSTLPSRHFRRILVAVDGSAAANWAVEVAADLARDLKARIAFLNAYCAPVGIATEYTFDVSVGDALRAAGEKVLADACNRLPKSLNPESFLREGNAAEEILNIARAWDADLIVVGARARSPVAQLFLGSTAEAIVRGATCPVMTISHRPSETRGCEAREATVEETVNA